MIKITLNEELRRKLHDLDRPLEIYDEAGRVLGHFIPKPNWEPTWTKEELEKIKAEPDYSTEEILRHLESL